jgi:hypothetical protein
MIVKFIDEVVDTLTITYINPKNGTVTRRVHLNQKHEEVCTHHIPSWQTPQMHRVLEKLMSKIIPWRFSPKPIKITWWTYHFIYGKIAAKTNREIIEFIRWKAQ